MSNVETRPDEQVCRAGAAPGAATGAPAGGGIEILEPREVPLGGPRAMGVRRTLPQRDRSMVGAWCFLDHYGPADVTGSAGMQVPPHPHTGLQTVSWLFEGEVRHDDSLGSTATIRPGELNLMTAGRGISHSEQSPSVRPPVLHGVQLWVALPDQARGTAPAFEHHGDLPTLEVGAARIRLFLGELAGVRSPATAYTPIVGAQVDLPPGGRAVVAINPEFEHALLVDRGPVRIDGTLVAPSSLAYAPTGRTELTLASDDDAGARLILIGGAPFGEQLVMWWNFVGRSHEEIVDARAQWQAGLESGSERFGRVEAYAGPALPAPELPNLRLRPRP